MWVYLSWNDGWIENANATISISTYMVIKFSKLIKWALQYMICAIFLEIIPKKIILSIAYILTKHFLCT